MDGYFRAAVIIPRIGWETDKPTVIRIFVTTGLGVACIPNLAKIRLRDGSTSWTRIREPACQFSLGIPWNEHRYLPPVTRAFRENVIARFAISPLQFSSGG